MAAIKLSGKQIDELQEKVVSLYFSGSSAGEEFAVFLHTKTDTRIYDEGWTTSSQLFPLQVSQVLSRLRNKKLEAFLEALKKRAAEDEGERGDSSISIDRIRQELESSNATGEGTEQDEAPQGLPRRILVAHGRFDKRFAEDIKNVLQNVMQDFEVVGTWENKYRLPEDIDKMGAVIALLVVTPPEKDVVDPPLNAVRTALKHLGPKRRVILLALDPRARSWTEGEIRNVALKDCVETEVFFGDDGRPIFIGRDPYKAVEIEFRVGEIGAKLQAAFEQAAAAEPAVAVEPALAATPRAGSPPVVLVGEPLGPASEDVARSIRELVPALKSRGLNVIEWPDEWRRDQSRRQPVTLLARDAVFVRMVDDAEIDTGRISEDLESGLRWVFGERESTLELLASCRRVLWRRAGPDWKLLGRNGNGERSVEDLDNLEARIAEPEDFANWLARFTAPDAVILHESLEDNRRHVLVRLLRDAVKRSLTSSDDRNPIIRLREFKELPSFGNDSLTIVAIDDLPLVAGVDFREKALLRFNQFHHNIDLILDQRVATADLPILRVAMLVHDASLFQRLGPEQNQGLLSWKPFRFKRESDAAFSVEADDVNALRDAAVGLIAKESARHRGTP